ncbi:MAG: GDP-mannose 4,6-dehydratase [archaeon]|nr:GDP-mannose 4,6-dehydratase [archaeon]
MNILVTGGAGFIGFHVIQSLLSRGDSVVVVDEMNSYYNLQLKKDRLKQIQDQITFYEISIWDYDKLKTVFQNHKFDVVCHLAAQAGVRYSLENPFAYEKANSLGTLTILQLMKEFDINKIVYASSSSVYGGNEKTPFSEEDNVDKPISLYAATKRANELYAYTYHHLYGFNCFGLRFFTVYGPWGRPDMALYKFTKAIIDETPIDVYNNGEMKRSFTYISDIVDGVLRSIDRVSGYEILNLGNDETVELSYFISCIEKELGKTAIKHLMPIQAGDVPVTFADCTKSKKILDWKPKVSIDDGVKHFVKWYQSYQETE